MHDAFHLREATEADVPLIFRFVSELAEYEKLAHEVTATEELLRRNLFSERNSAEVLLAFVQDEPAGFALFFQNFSTFLGKPGIYLEDLYVRPRFRRRGIGRAFMTRLAQLARTRNCGRFEWAVLNWNTPSLDFYKSLGAIPMADWTVMRVSGDALERLAAQAVPAVQT